ncbi:MAG: nucleoside hydrolase [Pseudomonadota bacterium]
MTRKIIYDTDPGIDDAMALLFAVQSPSLDLLGITTILGNASLEITTRNALYLTERFDIPATVFRGAAEPLVVPPGSAPDFVHGSDGLGNINPPQPSREASSLPAAEYIADTIMRYPGEVTLVAVGRLTNLALALELEPRIAQHVQEVIVMGGALGIGGHRGNITPCAEANIHGDPHAADTVMGADWPLVMVGLDVSMQVVMQDDRMQRIRDHGGDIGAFIYEISRFYENFYLESEGMQGFPVHDSSAMMYAVAPTLFESIEGPLRVVTEGIAIGQTVIATAAQAGRSPDWQGRPNQRVCTSVDAQRLLDLYENAICL